MSQKEELTGAKEKAQNLVQINIGLVAIAFTFFILIISLRPEILAKKILALQLILSIPILLTSTLVRAKLGYAKAQKRWDAFGSITFILGYAFLINVVGIFASFYVGAFIVLIFFVTNWVLAIIYSCVQVSYDGSKLKERLLKDSFFIILQIILGLMPAFGIL